MLTRLVLKKRPAKKTKRRPIDIFLDSQPFWNGCRPADPFKRIARAERRTVLDFCLNELDDEALEIVWLRHFYGLTFTAIALKVGGTEDAAWQTNRRALLQLKSALDRCGITKRTHV